MDGDTTVVVGARFLEAIRRVVQKVDDLVRSGVYRQGIALWLALENATLALGELPRRFR